MELNRGDGKIPPADKLTDTAVEKLDARWKILLPRGDEMREASFINKMNWKDWQVCCGNAWDITNALMIKSTFGTTLLLAFTDRLCALCRHWYDKLDVGSTFG